MKEIKLIIVGFGVVGKGVAKVLIQKRKELMDTHCLAPKIVAICERDGAIVDEKGIDIGKALSLAEVRKLNEHNGWSVRKTLDVIKDVDADAVIEVTPTNIETGEPGLGNMMAALDSGKHVITSNKGPLALQFSKLAKKAKDNNLELKYEATVCGGMPTFNMIKHGLQLNKISSIMGILNGTTNFILSKMYQEGISFESALNQAKEMGIAEANPTYDIEAIDSAAKVVILANSVLGLNKSYKDVKRVGITGVTNEAMQLAKKSNLVVKLIGEVNEDFLEVSPRLIPAISPLNVSGTLNALMLQTDLTGEVVVIGRGAGQMETASAILSDVISVFGSAMK